ncbi:hypothetical protein N7481_003188 [Penicillium waksmanii]|uniref:uncharacterized protein n=1 Tax=Penicillium waksmanii TaxID=69791 RepID=UPI002547DAFF|nr:uncharacterized protein N7481_003188 [Penicillium waksmanii]KAJ5987978.1 hypothetical protein N7481_003188 [Penicillium waksmanii]
MICVDSRDAENRTPLMIAAIMGEDTIIKQLLKSNAEVNAENEHKLTPLFLAVANSHAQAVKILLDHPGIRVNQKDEYGHTPFSYAAKRQLIQIMIDLIEKGADPHALEAENVAVINLLKEADNNSMHLLVEGLSSIDQEATLTLVKKLIQAGYNLDQVDPRGRTPLHLACLSCRQDIVSALISANADANSKDHTGKVPLQYALETRNKDLVDLLLNAPLIDLSRIGSEEWFFLGDKNLSWIQITKLAQQNNSFAVEYINELECNWLPSAKQTRLW